MKLFLIQVILCFSSPLHAEIEFARPSSEKICLTGMRADPPFDTFVRVVHNNQSMMNLPKSRLGLLSSVFVKLDLNHDGILAENEMTQNCLPCPTSR